MTTTEPTPAEARRRVRRRSPDDQPGWGDVPTSALERPYLRLLQAVLFAAAVLYGLNQLNLLGPSEPTIRTIRVTGEDPVQAAVSVAEESHGGGAPVVVMVGVGALADGVVATGLAGALDAPILLNEPAALAPVVRDVMRDLDTERVVLIGGPTALSALVEEQLLSGLDVEVTRIAGASRFDTATQVADLLAAEGEVGEINGLPTALIVPAENVAVALQAGALAASRADTLPVLLSQSGQLPEPTLRALDQLGIRQILVIPEREGTAQLTALEASFDGVIRVVEGTNAIADLTGEVKRFSPPRVVIVPAEDQARALIGGPLAGREAGVLLTADTALDWLAASCGSINEMIVIAELDAFSDDRVTEARMAAIDCPNS